MKSDFIIALTQLAAERNLPREIVLEAIEAALASAYKRDSISAGQNISVTLDPGDGGVSVYIVKTVAEVVVAELTPIRERYQELMKDPDDLDRLLARGAEQARAVSEPKLDEIKRRVGLTLPRKT